MKIATGTTHKIPADLQRALALDKAAIVAWEGITPLSRNEWICWTISVKKPETRRAHIERTVKELKEGKRRPCCWIGCVHRKDKEISPSVRSILKNKNHR